MLLDTLTTSGKQAQSRLPLDTLIKNNKPLAKEVKYYLDSSRQEGKSSNTITLYVIVLREFLNYNLVLHPDAHDIRNFLMTLQDRNLKPASVHVYYRTLKAFFNWLVKEEILTRSPMLNIKAPKLPKVIIRPFSLEDIRRMLVVSGGKRFYDVRNRALILAFLDTGVRLFEMAGMKRTDVNENTGIIRIMGKGQKERIVRIGSVTQKALSRYLYMRNDQLDALWLTEERTPLTREGLKIAMRRVAKLAEVTDARIGAHTFRHTNAIYFLRNKGDLFTLQQLLGHSTLEMTRRYTDLLQEDVVRVHKTASPVDNLKGII